MRGNIDFSGTCENFQAWVELSGMVLYVDMVELPGGGQTWGQIAVLVTGRF